MGNVVDEWMAAYDNPQKPLVEAVRQTILKSDKRIGETIKWQAPTFFYKGNLASFYPKSKARKRKFSPSFARWPKPARFNSAARARSLYEGERRTADGGR